MLEIEWTEKNGWGKPVICPLHNLSLHPGAKVLHYAIEVAVCLFICLFIVYLFMFAVIRGHKSIPWC
jgi:hypothetical protein